MAFERVAKISELPRDRGLCVELGGCQIGLYRVDGAVHAMEDACPHAGYPLHEGLLEGSVVTCSGHGWEYDVVTGRVPGTSGDHPIPRYAVELRGDEVWVDVEQRLS